MYTIKEVTTAIMIAWALGSIVGSCITFVWLAWAQEAKSTGRMDPRQAASMLGKRGRAKQLRTQAEKGRETSLKLRAEVDIQNQLAVLREAAAPPSAIDRYNSALNQAGGPPAELPPPESFAQWLVSLDAAATRRGYGARSHTDDTGHECWEEYFRDGLSPSGALAEDERHA